MAHVVEPEVHVFLRTRISGAWQCHRIVQLSMHVQKCRWQLYLTFLFRIRICSHVQTQLFHHNGTMSVYIFSFVTGGEYSNEMKQYQPNLILNSLKPIIHCINVHYVEVC